MLTIPWTRAQSTRTSSRPIFIKTVSNSIKNKNWTDPLKIFLSKMYMDRGRSFWYQRFSAGLMHRSFNVQVVARAQALLFGFITAERISLYIILSPHPSTVHECNLLIWSSHSARFVLKLSPFSEAITKTCTSDMALSIFSSALSPVTSIATRLSDHSRGSAQCKWLI